MCSRDFLQSQVAKIEALINAYMAAELALVSGGIDSYTFDSGQTKQSVTKFDIDKLRTAIDGLYNQYVTLCARLNGSGVLIARPAW